MSIKIRPRTVATVAVGAVAAVVAFAGPASATIDDPSLEPSGGSLTCTTPPPATGPEYVVRPVKFRAADESNADWTGSDEPFWIFSSVGTSGTNATSTTRTFGNVDTGDEVSFDTYKDPFIWGNRCRAKAAPNGVGLSVQLWEHDFGNLEEVRATSKTFFDYAGPVATVAGAPAWVTKATPYVAQGVDRILSWGEDDHIGSKTLSYSADQLKSRVPSVGNSFQETHYFGGASTSGGADYYLTVQVSRVR